MQDAWRAYLELALGLTEASRRKAEKVARDLVGKGGSTAAQVQGLVDELMSTSRANREGLVKLVRYEVDRALGAVGLATADEVAELTARVRKLEHERREPPVYASAEAAAAAPARATTGPAKTATTAKAAKAPAKSTKAAQAPAKSTKAAKAPVKSTKVAKAPADTAAKKTVRKQPAKKTTRAPQDRG